jgi:O-antigen/teichoic acid export membrane protein
MILIIIGKITTISKAPAALCLKLHSYLANESMSVLKKLAGETAIYGLSSILTRLVNWILLTPYFTARAFQDAPEAYGQINDLYFWIALLLVFTTYRMETAFFRFGRRQEDMGRAFATAMGSLLITTVLIIGLLLFFIRPMAELLHYAARVDYIFWFLMIVAADTLSAIPFARLRLEGRPLRFAFLKIAGIVINIGLIFFFFELLPWLAAHGVAFAQAYYRADDKVSYVFIANFLASVSVLLVLLPQFKDLRRFGFDRALWRSMVWYALPLIPAGLAAIINQLVGVPMIKELASPDVKQNLAMAGIYAAATKFAVMMNLFTQAYNYAAEPFFFRHSGQSDDKRVYGQAALAFAIVGCMAFLGIMTYIDIIQYLLGKNYREALGVVPILLLANLFLGLYYNFSIWFKLADQTRFATYIALSGMLITLTVNVWLIPQPAVGYYAPAWASLLCYGFMALAAWYSGRRYYPIPYPLSRIFLYIGISVALYGAGVLADKAVVDTLWLSLGLKTLLLLLFFLLVWQLEKQRIYALMGK